MKVRISASRRVAYSQIVEMTPEEWAEFKATPEDDMADRDGPLSAWLDLHEVCDGHEFDVDEIVVVDDAGKPVKPYEEYEGDH